jgi:hypothetical protein
MHSSEDKMCNLKFSEMAHEVLLSKTVKSKLAIAEGRDDDLDANILLRL